MLLMVFKGQSKVRLLPLGRLRSRKTKNPSLHPLKKKATTSVSRSRRHRCLRRVHVKASRHPPCRITRYAFSFIFPFQGDNKGVAIRVATRYTSQSVWEEHDEGCVALKEATGGHCRDQDLIALCPLREATRQGDCRYLGSDIFLVAFPL
ncbi:hypothetical protein Taro_018859 [Colocasia esculenta]|uniref:Uncharacterized protein n=1 Tax=Colocasia esculenta TaxID=4460 RepID=A0A843URU2_COLES|nr:hypothetical protein [Colocasia esculenta]